MIFRGRFVSRFGATPIAMIFVTPNFLPVFLCLCLDIRIKVPYLPLIVLLPISQLAQPRSQSDNFEEGRSNRGKQIFFHLIW